MQGIVSLYNYVPQPYNCSATLIATVVIAKVLFKYISTDEAIATYIAS